MSTHPLLTTAPVSSAWTAPLDFFFFFLKNKRPPGTGSTGRPISKHVRMLSYSVSEIHFF